ncbi:unnamed protein product [Acanthoscelides obtectus]|uniref:Uncharacterized protein n=1 Tax=Acanthoscelides obtectus TaxID=200917 RepID=A0A9P0P8C7_ACAOB|nr:unnamed protein product [Acanthoscelides obtectus]CAK1667520.1 hypothetical protein AOBTE_LOCUS25886 [Acanthoscelides obtectus]
MGISLYGNPDLLLYRKMTKLTAKQEDYSPERRTFVNPDQRYVLPQS